jgi:hypothetical protein
MAQRRKILVKTKRHSSWRQNPGNAMSIIDATSIGVRPSQLISKLLALQRKAVGMSQQDHDNNGINVLDTEKTPNCLMSYI